MREKEEERWEEGRTPRKRKRDASDADAARAQNATATVRCVRSRGTAALPATVNARPRLDPPRPNLPPALLLESTLLLLLRLLLDVPVTLSQPRMQLAPSHTLQLESHAASSVESERRGWRGRGEGR